LQLHKNEAIRATFAIEATTKALSPSTITRPQAIEIEGNHVLMEAIVIAIAMAIAIT
jgi:hypothetical protein